MADKGDSKEIIALKELMNSHGLQMEVLLRLLVKKDILTEQECIDRSLFGDRRGHLFHLVVQLTHVTGQ